MSVMCAYREGVDIAELLELEHQGWSSLCDRSGADFYAVSYTHLTLPTNREV